MKNTDTKKQITASRNSSEASANAAFFTEEVDPATEARKLTLEAVTRVLIWIAEAASTQSRGVRATVMLHCVRPDLIGGVTLEQIGDREGMSKQAAFNLAKDFRLSMGFSS